MTDRLYKWGEIKFMVGYSSSKLIIEYLRKSHVARNEPPD